MVRFVRRSKPKYIRLVLMLIASLSRHHTLLTILMRFLETGHTFLPNDSDFGDFECAIKPNTEVFTDEGYMKVMEEARITNKFNIHRMSSKDFFSVGEIENRITNRKFDVNKEKVNWLQTHEILLDKEHPTHIKMKRKLGDEFQTVSLAKTGLETDFGDINLCKLWPNGRILSKEKVKDLKSMLELFPEEHKHFYSFVNVVETQDLEEDVDGFPPDLDFEIEYD